MNKKTGLTLAIFVGVAIGLLWSGLMPNVAIVVIFTTVWTWLALSLAASLLLPVPDLTRANKINEEPPLPDSRAS
ncbi:MAG: hypothetical protein OXO50_00300 [Caldilineaceae bacterium]|nr:hypothetical protein [Caldilineaceae bacterium]